MLNSRGQDSRSSSSFEDRFRKKMMEMSNGFEVGIMKRNTDLILSNMHLISDLIMQYDARELVSGNVSILKMALERRKPKRILLAARKMSKYICWDNEIIYDLTMDVLRRNKIFLGPKGQRWLYEQIRMFERYLYS